MGTYTLSQQETAAIVAAAAPAYWPWPSGDNQRGHPFATRVPVRQIFDEQNDAGREEAVPEAARPGFGEGSAGRSGRGPGPGPSAGAGAGTGAGPGPTPSQEELPGRQRYPRDVLWLLLFLGLMGFVGYVSITLGLTRWTPASPGAAQGPGSSPDAAPSSPSGYSTMDFWPMFLVGEAIACFLAYALLSLLALYTNPMLKIFVHGLTTFLAVISVFCFWDKAYFWGAFFALGALLQFSYAIAVVDRLAYTMLVVRKALGFVGRFPALLVFAHTAVLVLAAWLVLWSFGLSGVVARQAYELNRWWVIVLLAVSAFWAGVVVSNIVHVVTADVITSWLLAPPGSAEEEGSSGPGVSRSTLHSGGGGGGPSLSDGGGPGDGVAPPHTGGSGSPLSGPAVPGTAASRPVGDTAGGVGGAARSGAGSAAAEHPLPRGGSGTRLPLDGRSEVALLLRAISHALLGLGSICYASLFTSPVNTLHWLVRGLRARCGQNECLFCLCACLFNAVETLTRFLNRFGYVTLAMQGQGFNRSSMDAWELFQSTGVEVLIAYDLSNAVVLMAVTLGALLTGTAVGVWAWCFNSDRVIMVGATSMLIGALLVSVTLTVVDAAVAAMYVVYAEDPILLSTVDAQFVAQLSEALLLRLQKRSGHRVEMNLASSGLPDGVPPV